MKTLCSTSCVSAQDTEHKWAHNVIQPIEALHQLGNIYCIKLLKSRSIIYVLHSLNDVAN